jgi:hypothetical protein
MNINYPISLCSTPSFVFATHKTSRYVRNDEGKSYTSYFQPQFSRAGVAHREADGREYPPVSWSAGMRVWAVENYNKLLPSNW